MKAVLVEGDKAGFIFANKKEYRAFMRDMKEKVKKLPKTAKDFSVLFPIEDVEFLDRKGFRIPVGREESA